MPSFSEAALCYAPWSYTMANVAHLCPFHFYQKYIARAASKDVIRIEGEVGSAVHRILDRCIKGTALNTAYNEIIETQNLTYDAEIAVHNYRSAINDFLQGLKIFQKVQQVTHTFSERRYGITKDFSLTRYKAKDCIIRGAIDLALITKHKQAIIIDHKSGTRKKTDAYSHQMAIYALLVYAACSDIGSIRTAIHYVGAPKNKKGTRTEWGPEYAIEAVKTRFREDIITWLNDAAEAGSTEKAQKSWLCEFCGYRHLCPL